MEINGGEIIRNDTNKNAMGGTELLTLRLKESLDPELLKNFQIVSSRQRELDGSKIRIFWAHDLPHDPESNNAFHNGGWKNYHVLVFVSNWQMQAYINAYKIPWSMCLVIQNNIVPIEKHEKPTGTLNLIYFSTPHRGLNILLPVFKRLVDEGADIHLNVYSSFKIYGWEDKNTQFESLFDECRSHPNITYHESVPHEEIREALKTNHILAYPSTWPETSCLVLMESMSAGLTCVHSNFAALPETAANWTDMYQFSEDLAVHANRFYVALKSAIENYASSDQQRDLTKSYADMFYNNERAVAQWTGLLNVLLESLPPEARALPSAMFTYKVG